ncbi:MAG: hypothetical protein FWD41_02500 [Actinomycetia bacterium]|nr:hypothetical protein [Actinomycetes bacterium]
MDMQTHCAHAVNDWDMCPARCSFAICDRPTYEFTTDPTLVFSPDIDRDATLKQGCLWCKFFLTNGPRKNPDAPAESEADRKARLQQSGQPSDCIETTFPA